MTDTPTPERGEFSDLLDTLCSTWHQKEETDYDHMRGSCSTLDAARADFAYREARRLVVKHVDALRAECARLNEIAEGWRVRYATGAHYNVFPDKDVATAIAAGIGGTAHAIYRRVEGDK